MVRLARSVAARFLEAADRVLWVEIVLRDGRTLQGAVVRNPLRHTGTIINSVTEQRHDFDIDDVQSLRYVGDPREVGLPLDFEYGKPVKRSLPKPAEASADAESSEDDEEEKEREPTERELKAL